MLQRSAIFFGVTFSGHVLKRCFEGYFGQPFHSNNDLTDSISMINQDLRAKFGCIIQPIVAHDVKFQVALVAINSIVTNKGLSVSLDFGNLEAKRASEDWSLNISKAAQFMNLDLNSQLLRGELSWRLSYLID